MTHTGIRGRAPSLDRGSVSSGGAGKGAEDVQGCALRAKEAIMRRAVVALVVTGSLVSLLVGLAGAQAKKPDATLTLSEGSVAVGIGFSWGKGTVTYKGKRYSFKVEGLSV